MTFVNLAVMRGYEERSPEESIVDSILVDPEAGQFVHLYDKQVDAAEEFLAQFITKTREAEDYRILMNRAREAIGLKPIDIVPEVEVLVPEGAFVLVDQPLAYEAYIEDRSQPFPEFSEQGVKQPGDKILFDRFKLSGFAGSETPTVQICIKEYPDAPLYNLRSKTDGRYQIYNLIRFEVGEHRMGFLMMDDADVEVRYPE